MTDRRVVCPYCEEDAKLVDSASIYGASYGLLWCCVPCQAWVGVHENSLSNRPKGTLAKKKLRLLRMEAHKQLDPLWRRLVKDGVSKRRARRQVYGQLAGELKITSEECHIAMFDEDMCRKAIEICRTWREAPAGADASASSPSD